MNFNADNNMRERTFFKRNTLSYGETSYLNSTLSSKRMVSGVAIWRFYYRSSPTAMSISLTYKPTCYEASFDTHKTGDIANVYVDDTTGVSRVQWVT